ncbi:GNAT family N-acetyltransferase [Bradyrhizobium sp. OK095]|uniref:GNAT family N-acetyltransferase n=1 Tax=Bradyrhizobium sp. OK095 TaxID=1882760 RepID=UPI000B82020A|nr:GNAT family N-acetyltransferase [Bradyrhizobium sp. OK095]
MDMLVKLYSLPKSDEAFAALTRTGIGIRRSLPPEKHKVVSWVLKQFGPGWASEVEIAFSHQPVGCFVAYERTKLLGFACHDATCANFFGPTGVDPSARNCGIGKALLFACLGAMKHQGFAYAIIGGVGPTEFYSKVVGAIAIEGSEPGIYSGLLS